jgi:hypothetical protein
MWSYSQSAKGKVSDDKSKRMFTRCQRGKCAMGYGDGQVVRVRYWSGSGLLSEKKEEQAVILKTAQPPGSKGQRQI